jgi:hypothetical protein
MNSVPITDVLPWGDISPPTGGRTILIYDSAESNGRFLLYTIAAQSLRLQSSYNNETYTKQEGNDDQTHVLWIHCGTKTDAQLNAGMKKNGCDVKGTTKYGENKVHILRSSISSSVPDIQPQQHPLWDENSLKMLYQQIKSLTSQWSKFVIILDDASLMSTYYGGNLTFAFIQKVRNLVRTESQREKQSSFIILASNDLDQECYTQSTNQQDKNVTGGKKMQYIGAGGKGMLQDPESLTFMELGSLYELEEMVWERALIELADGVVDVLPLTSGFAKDVHGRLVFTCQRGGGLGWRDGIRVSGNVDSNRAGGGGGGGDTNHFSTTLVNYCCTDAGVKAIRLRV